ncbi:hypothetical protein JCM10914A_41580 [Paenibacillus sp. JCM 10914]|uniref:hypothetical protein n=1 Tax=Paenibacillus sp. JCM 10914 TaxID=1236974 RepID=UPI0003CC3C85|nr:hypothetical protein [Paenibacillus sp. JCM 10914]GAE05373.1 hypothetical protein JCM10914_1471 [Paenibacillus sp. JCM 10914]
MKITDLAIIFTAIFLPMFIILGFRSENLEDIRYVELKYSSALRTAAQDAGFMLNVNASQGMEPAYDSLKFMNADKELALESFAKTLYINMGIAEDPAAQAALWWYIPALVVIDYDGYYIYALQSYESDAGEEVLQHVWSPKIPYAWTDSIGNSVHFTLDSYVNVYESASRQWQRGYQKELSGRTLVRLLDNEDTFEQMRRITIVNQIQEHLTYYIQRHNQGALRNGISYNFMLPYIAQEEWLNTIDDIGLLAFIQGLPIGDQYYNNYALGGGRLVKNPVYYGSMDHRGIRYYYREVCSFGDAILEVFPSAKQAAAAGYLEKSCVNPGVL